MGTNSETYLLDGVTVIDFSRLLPGPECAQMFGGLGAVVIKVEETKLSDSQLL
ncbi:MAG: CoA transferase [Gammaproteobacteria bacterium]|nr:CoA transferase [Gammaproteobacteria bacterium]